MRNSTQQYPATLVFQGVTYTIESSGQFWRDILNGCPDRYELICELVLQLPELAMDCIDNGFYTEPTGISGEMIDSLVYAGQVYRLLWSPAFRGSSVKVKLHAETVIHLLDSGVFTYEQVFSVMQRCKGSQDLAIRMLVGYLGPLLTYFRRVFLLEIDRKEYLQEVLASTKRLGLTGTDLGRFAEVLDLLPEMLEGLRLQGFDKAFLEDVTKEYKSSRRYYDQRDELKVR
jgi:hypothetical protein